MIRVVKSFFKCHLGGCVRVRSSAMYQAQQQV